MIVSVRGACGAGKSTLVRRIMGECVVAEVLYRLGRRRPTGQILLSGKSRIFVPGHYDIACGGIDTMDLDDAYELIAQHASLGAHVLYEGHNAEDGPRRLLRLSQSHDCRVALLRVDPDECLRRVRTRGSRMSEVRLRRLHGKLITDLGKFEDAGLDARHSDPQIVEMVLREWLL